MTRRLSPGLLSDLKVRHFLLQAKAITDLRRRPGALLAMTDAELHELMKLIWIAERARELPEPDLLALARTYTISDWRTRDHTPDAMESAMSRASAFYDGLDAGRQRLLI